MTFEDYRRWRDNEEDRSPQKNNRRGKKFKPKRIFKKKGAFERKNPIDHNRTPPERANIKSGGLFDFSNSQPEQATQVASLDPGYAPDWLENQEAIIEGIKEIFPEFANIALDFVPIVGDIKGVAEAIVGKDITGAELANWERALGAVPVFGGVLKRVKAGKKVKAFIKLPGVWIAVDTAGKKFDELIDYLASKLPSWKQPTPLAIGGAGGYEVPSDIASSMMNAMTDAGADAGKNLPVTNIDDLNDINQKAPIIRDHDGVQKKDVIMERMDEIAPRSDEIIREAIKTGKIPDRAQNRINIRAGSATLSKKYNGSGLNYALSNHLNPAKAVKKSQFSISKEEIIAILMDKNVIQFPVTVANNSINTGVGGLGFLREIDLAQLGYKTIGNYPTRQPLNGMPTSKITIITDGFGNLKNVFPGFLNDL